MEKTNAHTSVKGSEDSQTLSVSQALNVAKYALESINVTVMGEISELSDKSGYKAVYFTLSDKNSAMPCLMWKDVYAASDLQLRVGMLVEVSGSFSLYAAKGRMNFTARHIRLAGEGDLRIKVAEIAKRLERAGLMDPSRKKPLPFLPSKIALVTSPRGKAVHDCLRTLRRRYPLGEIYVCGVAVEGAQAPAELSKGLDIAEASGAEVILLVRGGGSYEDLMPFNDESLARRVAACRVPVVTGIGHEPDNSIVDMVADLRCSTPTAAAEALAPASDEIAMWLEKDGIRLASALTNRMSSAKTYLDHISSRPVFSHPIEILKNYYLSYDYAQERLPRVLSESLAKDVNQAERLSGRFVRVHEKMFSHFDKDIAIAASRLQDLSPLNIILRGYAVTYGADGKTVIDSITKVEQGDAIMVRVSDGEIRATVTEKQIREV